MNKNSRISLIDPILYNSTYINPHPPKIIKINFWKKFDFLNFMMNIGIPLTILIFVLFILKAKYINKLQRKFNNDQKNDSIPIMQIN